MNLHTEGGWRFVVFFALLFGGSGVWMGWQALSGEAGDGGGLTLGAVFVGCALLVLFLSREEILAAFDLYRERVEVPARVLRLVRSDTTGRSAARYRWRIEAEGRRPDGGGPTTFLSPAILADLRPPVAEGSIVMVDVSPRTGRYRMKLESLSAGGPATGGASVPAAAGAAREASSSGIMRWLPFAFGLVFFGGIGLGLLSAFFPGVVEAGGLAGPDVVGPVVGIAVVGLFAAVAVAMATHVRRLARSPEARGDALPGGPAAGHLAVARFLTVAAAALALGGFLFFPLFAFAAFLFVIARLTHWNGARRQGFEAARAGGLTRRFRARVTEVTPVERPAGAGPLRWSVRATGAWPDGTADDFVAEFAQAPGVRPGDAVEIDGDPSTRLYAMRSPA